MSWLCFLKCLLVFLLTLIRIINNLSISTCAVTFNKQSILNFLLQKALLDLELSFRSSSHCAYMSRSIEKCVASCDLHQLLQTLWDSILKIYNYNIVYHWPVHICDVGTPWYISGVWYCEPWIISLQVTQLSGYINYCICMVSLIPWLYKTY